MNFKIIQLIVIGIFACTFLSSCTSDDEVEPLYGGSTNSIAMTLQQEIEKNNINRVIPRTFGNSSWLVSSEYGDDYLFNGDFIQIENDNFNLNHLISYTIETREDDRFLMLFF